MNIKSLSLSRFVINGPDSDMKSEVTNLIDSLESDIWYLISPKGIEFDLSGIKQNMESIDRSHIILDFDAIRLNLFYELSDFNKLVYGVHNPIYGTEKLGLTPLGLIVKGEVLIEAFKLMRTMRIHGLSTLVMLTPTIFRVIEARNRGILLTEVPWDGILLAEEYDEESLQIIRSYVETLLGDKTELFIKEFSHAIQ